MGKYVPNDLKTGDTITRTKTNNWDRGILDSNNKRKRPNLLSDDIALCNSTDGWTTTNITLTTDTSNQNSGDSCLKLVLTSTEGNIYRDVLSLLDTSKYYIVAVNYRNEDMSTGMLLRINCVGDVGNLDTTNTTATDYTQKAVVLQPTDFDGASEVRLTLKATGSSTQFAYADEVFIYEISKDEYDDGATTLLTELPFTSSSGVESYSNVISLPGENNMSNGKLDVVLEGQSTSNTFEDNDAGLEVTTGWTDTGLTSSNDSSNNLEGTNCRKLTLSGAEGNTYKDILSKLDTACYYLFSVSILNEDMATGVRLRINCVGDVGIIDTSDVSNTYYTRIGIAIQPSDFDGASEVRVTLKAAGASSEVAYADALLCTKITEEDFNSLADRTDASDLFDKYAFHRGIKGSSPKRFKCVKKNLFNKDSIVRGERINESTGANVASASRFRTDFVKIKASTSYIVSGHDSSDIRYALYNSNYEYITGAQSNSFTSNANVAYVKISDLQTQIDTLQLELGSTATNYEEYIESLSYVSNPYYSVPGGIKDSYNINTGLETIKVKSYTLQSGDIDSVVDGTNLQRAVIGLDAFSNIDTQNASTIDLTTLVSYLISETNGYDTSGDENKWYTDGSNLYVLASLGTWADVAAARTALTSTVTTVIHYALAQNNYEVKNYKRQELNAFAGGELYKDEVIRETLVYDSGLTLDANYTPLSAEKIEKYDFNNDTWENIKLTSATIGATTTISGASDGELYRIAWRYVFNTSSGKLNYMYCFNSKDQSNGNAESIKDMLNEIETIKTKLNRTLLDIDATKGDLIYSDADYSLSKLVKGTAYQHLGMNSGATLPEWQESANSVLTAQGDLLYADGANSLARLAKGTAHQSLRMNSGATAPEWGAITAFGTFTLNQSIGASSSYTLTIPLGFSANHGRVMMEGYSSNFGGLFHFSTTASEAQSMNFDDSGQNQDTKVTFRSGSTQLSNETEYHSGGSGLYVESIVINGTDLEITFTNGTGGSLTAVVDYGTWEVFI